MSSTSTWELEFETYKMYFQEGISFGEHFICKIIPDGGGPGRGPLGATPVGAREHGLVGGSVDIGRRSDPETGICILKT